MHVCIYYIFMEVDLQRWFFLNSGFYVKPYFPVKEVCLDWQKLILQIQIHGRVSMEAGKYK